MRARRAQRAFSRFFGRVCVFSLPAFRARGLPVDAGVSCGAGLADATRAHVFPSITGRAKRGAGVGACAVFAVYTRCLACIRLGCVCVALLAMTAPIFVLIPPSKTGKAVRPTILILEFADIATRAICLPRILRESSVLAV